MLDPEDRFDNHIADTLTAGKGLCEPEVVEMVVREAPDRINELIGWGTHFDQVNGRSRWGWKGDIRTPGSHTPWETRPGARSCGR